MRKAPNPEELRMHSDHLKANPRRVLGVSSAKLIRCAKHDQFYPATEHCQWCLSPEEERAQSPTAKSLEPAEPAARTLGQRMFDSYYGKYYPNGNSWEWSNVDQQYWEAEATKEWCRLGPAAFDAMYP